MKINEMKKLGIKHKVVETDGVKIDWFRFNGKTICTMKDQSYGEHFYYVWFGSVENYISTEWKSKKGSYYKWEKKADVLEDIVRYYQGERTPLHAYNI